MLEKSTIKAPVLIEDLGMMFATASSKQKRRHGMYLCTCGEIFKSTFSHVKDGHTNSCGCYQQKQLIISKKIHGLYKHRIHKIWREMIGRTSNINNHAYSNYGGRGIKICEAWVLEFISFYNWSNNNGYAEDLTIDRIDNDGNYEPSNCRWTTKEVQARNTRILRSNNTSGYRGVSFDKISNKWRSEIMVSNKSIYLGMFFTALDAAMAYDKYIIDNKLEHTTNGLY